jgi:hypothetical protein
VRTMKRSSSGVAEEIIYMSEEPKGVQYLAVYMQKS